VKEQETMTVSGVSAPARGLKVLGAGLLALWMTVMLAGCGAETQHVTPPSEPVGAPPGGGDQKAYMDKMKMNVHAQGTR
jgi:hypothetical protein